MAGVFLDAPQRSLGNDEFARRCAPAVVDVVALAYLELRAAQDEVISIAAFDVVTARTTPSTQ